MGMTSSEGRVAPIEGVLEQMNERMGILEAQNLRILEQKADKSEVRLLFVTVITLLVAIIGLLGALMARSV
jgi:C4-type Zn-finger protein